MTTPATIPTHFLARSQLIERITQLEHAAALGEVAAAVAERRRIAEQLRDHARQGSRKMAGTLRMVADLIEQREAPGGQERSDG
jgi:hypothetical protein